MMKIRFNQLFLFVIFNVFCLNLWGYEDQLALKGGLGLTGGRIRSFNNSKDLFMGLGAHTQIGYRFTQWEFNLASYIYFARIKKIEYHTTVTQISGNSNFRSVSFGPVIKHIFLKSVVNDDWYPYLSIGPIWSQQTIKIDYPVIHAGTFQANNRICYQSRGVMVGAGIEEILSKDLSPVYIELTYSYKESSKIYLLNSPNKTKFEIISHEDTKERIYSHILMLNMGVTIF